MQLYYLKDPLSASDAAEVADLTGWSVTQVRVPFLLPVHEITTEEEFETAIRAAMTTLRASGVLKHSGQRVALVHVDLPYLNSVFAEAIGRLTRSWPFLVQTSAVLAGIGHEAPLRVLDFDKAMRE